MKFKLIAKLLAFLGKRLDGYKTILGGVGGILTGLPPIIYGVLGILGTMFPDQNLPAMELDKAWDQIMLGSGIVSASLAVLGLGGKAEKLRREVAEGR